MLGLKRGTVKLTNNHEEWARLFEEEKKLLLKKFGNSIIAIEHIGSTATPGVPAKPIIDMNVAIVSLDNDEVQKFIEPLEKMGYEYKINEHYDDRLLFVKGHEENRTHHLNLVQINNQTGWHDPILFREYIKNNLSAQKEYAALKIKLAEQFLENRKAYSNEKQSFTKDIIQKARQKIKVKEKSMIKGNSA